jgi:hypothetical protein
MRGTIMALSSITMAAGVTVEGRALARNGLVSMISDRISVPACVRGGSSATPSPGTPSSGAPSSGTPSSATPPPTDTIRQSEPAGVGYGVAILFLLLLAGVLRLALGAPLLRNRRR